MEYLLSLMTDPAAWMAFLSLAAIEIVLGIDNLVFISVLSNKLPPEQRSQARRIGIAAALVLRLVLLGIIAFIIRLTEPVISIHTLAFSWKDIILIAGGLFLLWKATREIHHLIDPEPGPDGLNPSVPAAGMWVAVTQILLLDLVFSVDSIITAVGMTEHLPIMVAAVVIAVGTMLLAADPLGNFIHRNPTIVMLALGFLLLIGTVLVADGFGAHLPRGYIYSAMAFAGLIEGLNMAARRARARRRARAESTD
ncbi:MAG: TerC family protein [Xanthomonadales bacterium]|nr:TerC family protein [Xanthomonadales bacterium]